jgi:hypothetical protein
VSERDGGKDFFNAKKITRTDKHSGDVELHLFVEFRGNKKEDKNLSSFWYVKKEFYSSSFLWS